MAIRRTKRGFVLTDEHAHDYVRMVANDTGQPTLLVETTAPSAIVQEIWVRHAGINRSLQASPGMFFRPCDAAAAHADRGKLLRLLISPEEPTPPNIESIRSVIAEMMAVAARENHKGIDWPADCRDQVDTWLGRLLTATGVNGQVESARVA